MYLILKRIISRGEYWQGVTGAPENNEIIAKGAKRELYEETGYRAFTLIKTDIFYMIPMQDKWKDIFPEDTKEIPEYLFIAKINETGPPQIDPIEHDGWKWCSYEEALDLLSWKKNKSALEFVHKFLNL